MSACGLEKPRAQAIPQGILAVYLFCLREGISVDMPSFFWGGTVPCFLIHVLIRIGTPFGRMGARNEKMGRMWFRSGIICLHLCAYCIRYVFNNEY